MVIAYKIYIIPITLTVDFPTLLSLLLALFSVALSALFYFKATDTSNAFYDNTYKFTKDIAELLVKIESGFGERLRHLDEGYSSMRDYFQKTPGKQFDGVEKTKQKLVTEEQEVEKVESERNEIIRQLVERSQLQQGEKERVLSELKSKEEELSKSLHEVNRLKKHLLLERMEKRKVGVDSDLDMDSGFTRFTLEHVVEKIGPDRIIGAPSIIVKRHFSKIQNALPRAYLRDMERNGLLEEDLTSSGVRFLKVLASKEKTQSVIPYEHGIEQ